MAFENIQIVTTINGATPITGWRQDLTSGDTIGLSLSSAAGVSSFSWQLVGRPEGSSAGGTGPEPVSLGTSSTASFIVDADGTYPLDGTYIVHCLLNGGSPSQATVSVGVARLSTRTTPDGRLLRKLGAGEVDEDTSVANCNQGYATMINRWLSLIGTGGGGISVVALTQNPVSFLSMRPATNYAVGTLGLWFAGSAPVTPMVFMKTGTTNLATDWVGLNSTVALLLDPTLSAPAASTVYLPGTIGLLPGGCAGDEYFLCCGYSQNTADWVNLSRVATVVGH